MRFVRRGTLVVVRHGLVIVGHLVQGRDTHCKTLHGEQLFDGRHEIHAVAGDKRCASRGRAEVILHVDD